MDTHDESDIPDFSGATPEAQKARILELVQTFVSSATVRRLDQLYRTQAFAASEIQGQKIKEMADGFASALHWFELCRSDSDAIIRDLCERAREEPFFVLPFHIRAAAECFAARGVADRAASLTGLAASIETLALNVALMFGRQRAAAMTAEDDR